MTGNSIADNIDSFFTAVSAVSQELLPSQEADDIFLTIQRATFAVSKFTMTFLLSQERTSFPNSLSSAVHQSFALFVI